MAFVTPLPLAGPLTCCPALTRAPPPPARPARRFRVLQMSASDIAASSSPIIKRARGPHDLDCAYLVWDIVSTHEDRRPPIRDERDGEATTQHLIARSPGGKPVGAARLLRVGQNARLDRVAVLPSHRGRGVGRALVERLLVLAAPVKGAIYVQATRGAEMGFFSILGFESLGNDVVEEGEIVRCMVYRVPVCTPAMGCVGLHHTSIRVMDIERSLAFYGSIGFAVTDKFFTSAGNRACYVEGLGTRLEFVEASDGRGGLTGVQGVPPAGFDRLVFDVAKACTDLDCYLEHLRKRNGGILEVVGPPAKQVLGHAVVSVATIADPDGLPIEFIKEEAQVPGELRTKVDW